MSLPDVLQRTFIPRKFYLQYYPRKSFPKTFLGTRKVLHDFQKVVFQTIFLKNEKLFDKSFLKGLVRFVSNIEHCVIYMFVRLPTPAPGAPYCRTWITEFVL